MVYAIYLCMFSVHGSNYSRKYFELSGVFSCVFVCCCCVCFLGGRVGGCSFVCLFVLFCFVSLKTDGS